MTTEFQFIAGEYRSGLAFLKLDRKDKRNAINDLMIEELGQFFDNLAPETRAVVVHAEGEHFCAGLDLVERMQNRSTDPLSGIKRSRTWHRVFDQIEHGNVPVISVLKGGVIGGGLELASSTHIRICEASTYFQLPEGQRGIFVGGGASVRVPRIIGAGRVTEMMLTGRRLDAEEGCAMGLGHYLVPDGQGMAKAEELAASVASNSAVSNFAIINGVSRIADMGTSEGFFAESVLASMTAQAGDFKSRTSEFFDQRRRTRDERN
ncbi:crotonase/enoyl-CoA hydratase family protein [Hoeflea alexandrii]|uniref:crotonase/enoyl-CoA hydratase family protein n=1 Tax=Hoeflea alexandrii TaxID=288436 RepID=UPI0022AE5A1D|nr:crotonase/enoyl-CoA hydratase family protein [Hoeflea alexandrii]MCZ4291594.1 crotonase/enoyl-CoA hydratase family protein [Hoeflea alexandrii]